jgi:hypothetical protein
MTYTFTLTNGTAGTDCDHNGCGNRNQQATTGIVQVYNTQDTIDEADETFTINNGAVSATGTIFNDNAPTVTNHKAAVFSEQQ